MIVRVDDEGGMPSQRRFEWLVIAAVQVLVQDEVFDLKRGVSLPGITRRKEVSPIVSC